jgi:cyclopropane fatty-acyl-phospholipid synthase-like methyltransferase
MEAVIEPHSTSYDEMPYPAAAYRQSHVARLEALAKLFGMAPSDTRHSRVLELGCADGTNLIPMACALSESAFLGVDLSARQIKVGRKSSPLLDSRTSNCDSVTFAMSIRALVRSIT